MFETAPSYRRTALLGLALLLATVSGWCVVSVLDRTMLAIRRTEPSDRAAPPLPNDVRRPLRITVLGTSLSSANRYHWPDEVAHQLAGRISRPVQVQRIAGPGATSAWGVTQIDEVLATKPDVVLVELAVNDADIRRHRTVGASVAAHERVLAGLLAARPGMTIVLLTMNPATGPRGWARPFLSRYYAEYSGLADRYDTGLVDLYPRWLALPVDQRKPRDGLHPADSVATSVIVPPLVDVLAGAAG